MARARTERSPATRRRLPYKLKVLTDIVNLLLAYGRCVHREAHREQRPAYLSRVGMLPSLRALGLRRLADGVGARGLSSSLPAPGEERPGQPHQET